MPILLGAVLLSLASACERNQPEKRYYQEVVFSHAPDSQTSQAGSAQVHEQQAGPADAASPLPAGSSGAATMVWDTPAGWTEQPGQGMRRATFTVGEPSRAEGSLVILGGGAGGLESNIKRWMGQIDLSVSDPELWDYINQLTVSHTSEGHEVHLVNLGDFRSDASPGSASILAGIVSFPNATVFVKLTGAASVLDAEQQHLRNLCTSLRFAE